MIGPSAGGGALGRRRSLDAEVNLVSFIDLLSMCICFLLMTAVWVQIGAVQVKQTYGTEGADTSKELEAEVRFSGPLSLSLSVKKAGRVVKEVKVQEATIPAL